MLYWKIFNLCLRGVGIAFLVAGIIGAVYFFPILVDSRATIDVNGVPTNDPLYKLLAVALPVAFGALGFLIVRAKPYYPSHIRNKSEG